MGAEVVAASGALSFRGGTVVKLTADEVTIEYGRPDQATGKKPTQTVPSDRVWPRAATPLSDGAVAICNVSELVWLACRVKSARGTTFGIEDSYGRARDLERGAIVVVDEATQKTLSNYLARERAHRTFDAAFLAAGTVAKPAGWEPGKGAKVVIHFVGTSWYGGTVEEYLPDKRKARIEWDGRTWQARDVALDEIVPQPSKPASVRPEQFVLVRPTHPARRWEHQRVVSVSGNELELSDRNGDKHEASADAVIPVVPM
jgi:hypothetical protein